MPSLTLFAPAKLNLFLAITGRRPDGFHDLVSVVVPLEFGDQLVVDTTDTVGTVSGRFQLTCSDPDVPVDTGNLVLRAAEAFAAAADWNGEARFHLEKRIPMGAGLGGGSSDGATALCALNRLAGEPLGAAELADVAASLGSDCPLFLAGRPAIMRGRGERLEALPSPVATRLRGRRVLVFKPQFGIPTAWAYRRLAEVAAGREDVYLTGDTAEKRIAAWIADDAAGPERLLFNALERPAFEKYLALPTLLDELRRRFALQPRMTGSGSACFAFLPEDAPVDEIVRSIREAWGDTAFATETKLA